MSSRHSDIDLDRADALHGCAGFLLVAGWCLLIASCWNPWIEDLATGCLLASWGSVFASGYHRRRAHRAEQQGESAGGAP